MVDFLELAKNRLRWLERAWPIIMTFGTITALETGLFTTSVRHSLFDRPIGVFFFSAFGLLTVPYLIGKALPLWNIISPAQDRRTIWETDFVVFIVTTFGLTMTAPCFLGLQHGQASKVVFMLALICSPLLWITAQHRRKVHLMETPKMTGYVNPQTKLELDEHQKRLGNNFLAYILSGFAGAIVQLLLFSICLILMDKGAVFSFFATFIIVSLIINMTIPPIAISVYRRFCQHINLGPRSQYFMGASIFTIASIAVPKLISIFRSLSDYTLQTLAIQSSDLIAFVMLTTYVLGFLIGALVFGKRYMTRPESLDFA